MKRLLHSAQLAFLCFTVAIATASYAAPALIDTEATTKRIRVIVDNDFGGDPDGLFLLAHLLLSPSIEVRGIVCSQHYPTGFYGAPGTPAHAREKALELVNLVDPSLAPKVVLGADRALAYRNIPADSAAARLIIQEALREDTQVPLYVLCGGGLTNLASAYLLEPGIEKRLRLVWIGGPEHSGLAFPPPGAGKGEYNLGIDRIAAQVIFNVSAIPLWQIPRDAYRQALVTSAELNEQIGHRGALGDYLLRNLDDLMRRAKGSLGEAYVLGDNPLVLLSALQSSWERDPSSSRYVERPAPSIGDQGNYEPRDDGRPIRIYTMLDTRLMFEDLFAKIRRFDRPHSRRDP